jgi:hypothetical protein
MSQGNIGDSASQSAGFLAEHTAYNGFFYIFRVALAWFEEGNEA